MIRAWFINLVAKNTLKAVVPSDVLKQNTKTGEVSLGSQPITSQELNNLYQEILALRGLRLWSILTSSVAEQANRTMFENSTSWDDMVYGKAILYVLSLQESIIRVLEVQKKRVDQIKADTESKNKSIIE